MRVNVVCRNHTEDRVLPRMARALEKRLGWTLTARPDPGGADAVYLLGYFEGQKIGRTSPMMAAYFTHREELPVGNAKAALFDEMARRVDLRVVMCRLYGRQVERFGPTLQPPLPVELERFTPVDSRLRGNDGARSSIVVGLSGYTYSNHRKGEDLVKGIIESKVGRRVEWQASGRGWPVETKRYAWKDMPQFYQGLDVLVCPSRVEGGPMPVLEALACGVPVVVPAGVGIIDELPRKVAGIYRYECGDLKSLTAALERAVDPGARVDWDALRAAVAGHSVEAFCEAHRVAFEMLLDEGVDGGLSTDSGNGLERIEKASAAWPIHEVEPVEMKTGAVRGIYCVAFGDPARRSALRLMESIKKHMPDVPIALCAAKKIGPEDILIVQPDSDVGGRRAKLKAYELAPAEWQAVLYLDADTEVVSADARLFFEWIEDGWDLVITKDPHLMDTLHAFARKNNRKEVDDTVNKLKTKHTLQWNGGVWAFGRSKRIAAFFRRWQKEWEVHAQRDQGALVRAMYADPLKILLLGNEWNCFEKYSRGIKAAAIKHYPGDARRWKGLIPGRIDSQEAWAMVEKEQRHRR